jgi:hypothetical protein
MGRLGGGSRRGAARGLAQVGRTSAGRTDAIDGGRLEELADDLASLDVVDRRARLDDQPVRQRGLGEGLDIVGDDVVAAEEAGQRLPGASGFQARLSNGSAALRCARCGLVTPVPMSSMLTISAFLR